MLFFRNMLGLTLLAANAGAGAATAQQTVTATFNATDDELPNPERGFYRPLKTDLAQLDVDDVRDAFSQGYRLMYARIDLAPYRETDELPPSLLRRLDRAFADARRSGMKLIVRAVYNYPQGETGYQDAQDAPLPRVLTHIAQLKPVWQRNGDVIAVVQAGFVGAWGEWHASSNELAEPGPRTAIKDALLDAVPASRSIQFRYPPYITQWAPTLPVAAPAAPGNFRIGFHNDCFLASRTDVGTFEEDAAKQDAQKLYLDRLTDIAPFGGETCNPADEANPTPRTTCADILAEGKRFNLTYLNASYYRGLFHDRWVADGCMLEVSRSMGYRIALIGAAHPAVVTRGQPMHVGIVVRNAGWARLYNPRAVTILLRDAQSGRVRRIVADGVDPRRWLPGTESEAILRIALPADLAPGPYDLLLALPDADQRLADDPRFAIRFANADDAANGQRWNASHGAFSLGTAVTVQ